MKTLTITYEEENETIVLTALEELPVLVEAREPMGISGKKLWFPTYFIEPNQTGSLSREGIYGNDGR